MNKILLKQISTYTPFIKNGSVTQKDNDNIDIDNFLHFPAITNNDGSLWKHGNLYLLSKLKQYKKPSAKTLDSIAGDLKNFKEWCDDEEINYTKAPRRVQRPTYQYREHLEEEIEFGRISQGTAKRRISSVVGFYRYLIDVENLVFKFPLWEEGITSIQYKNSQGFNKVKKVITTDIGQIYATSNPDLFDNSIEDGGRLHPLNEKEQRELFIALEKLGNIEMTLGFLISVVTGARIQTVYTLKRKHFKKEISNNKEIAIKVGFGTSCDTKNNKLHTLNFPSWLYSKIQTYLKSQRAAIRLDKAKHLFEDNDTQYAFLNRSGAPYYVSTDDKYRSLYRDIPSGNAIRQFISKSLSKELNIKFSFHDLRATYGMNLLNKLMVLVEKKQIELSYALITVKERMGHNNLSTTEKYLNFRNKNKIKVQAQDEFESFLSGLLND